MTDRTAITTNLEVLYESFGRLLTSLTPAQWAAPSLCPGWTARDVAAHVTIAEIALLGWRPDDAPPFSGLHVAAAELAAVTSDELLARYRDVTARRVDELRSMTDETFDSPSFTPVGPGTYGRFMEIRVFDIWVHERDIRVSLGLTGDDSGPAAEMALDEVQKALGYIVGKKIGLPDGLGIAFHVTGATPRSMYVHVDGRAREVAGLAAPDVTLTTDSLTFLLLACGRIDPDEPIGDGRVAWSGISELGERAARNLAFTI